MLKSEIKRLVYLKVARLLKERRILSSWELIKEKEFHLNSDWLVIDKQEFEQLTMEVVNEILARLDANKKSRD